MWPTGWRRRSDRGRRRGRRCLAPSTRSRSSCATSPPCRTTASSAARGSRRVRLGSRGDPQRAPRHALRGRRGVRRRGPRTGDRCDRGHPGDGRDLSDFPPTCAVRCARAGSSAWSTTWVPRRWPRGANSPGPAGSRPLHPTTRVHHDQDRDHLGRRAREGVPLDLPRLRRAPAPRRLRRLGARRGGVRSARRREHATGPRPRVAVGPRSPHGRPRDPGRGRRDRVPERRALPGQPARRLRAGDGPRSHEGGQGHLQPLARRSVRRVRREAGRPGPRRRSRTSTRRWPTSTGRRSTGSAGS